MSNIEFDPRDPRLSYVDARALWALVGVFAAIELALTVADWGIAPNLRGTAFIYGAFWSALLDETLPVYALQPYTMFVTHAFLHGSLIHLGLNGAILLAIGRIVVVGSSQSRALLIFMLSAIGGAAVYNAFAGPELAPMVGASGGVFGYFAVWKRWELQGYRAAGVSADPVWKFLIGFLVINVALTFVMPNIAWAAHLGGFITGWLLAPALRRAPRPLM